MSSLVFVGIDVSQARLDIAVRPGAPFSIAHTESALATLVEQLRALSPILIVLEATGGMEIPFTSALATAGLPVVVVNPRQVRDFAKASGNLAKTDALDAQVLAQFAEVMRPQPAPTSGCRHASLGRSIDAPPTAGRDADGREESSPECLVADSEAGTGPYRLARTGAGPYQRGAVGGHSPEPGVARKRRTLAECAGCGSRRDLDPVGESPGTRHVDEQANRGPRRRGAAESRQRHVARATHRLERTGAGARRPLYERHCRGPVQSGDPDLLSALVSSRESEEGGAHGVHA